MSRVEEVLDHPSQHSRPSVSAPMESLFKDLLDLFFRLLNRPAVGRAQMQHLPQFLAPGGGEIDAHEFDDSRSSRGKRQLVECEVFGAEEERPEFGKSDLEAFDLRVRPLGGWAVPDDHREPFEPLREPGVRLLGAAEEGPQALIGRELADSPRSLSEFRAEGVARIAEVECEGEVPLDLLEKGPS